MRSGQEALILARLFVMRLVLPIAFVVGMISIPFVWFPELPGAPIGKPPPVSGRTSGARGAGQERAGISHMPFPGDSAGQSPSTPAGNSPAPPPKRTPFQRYMTMGFALILLSVLVGGVMLYGITRRQTVGFRRRFAPKKGPVRSGGENKSAS